MNNLLLITDVARLRKIFGRLADDKNVRLRIVNNLEKGGEEITIEKPDIVFVQTHLSGLSAEILLMHLKKQLGRKRSRFVLMASPAEINDAALKPYQGWLNTSADDNQLLSDIRSLIAELPGKHKKSGLPDPAKSLAAVDGAPQPVSGAESSALLDSVPISGAVIPQQNDTRLNFPVATPAITEPSLEELGITYAPSQRLSVYSDFNISFDSAVSTTPEPITLEQDTPAVIPARNAEEIETVETGKPRSKKGMFLLWLAPVIIAVVGVTYLQQQKAPPKQNIAATIPAPAAVQKPAAQTPAPVAPAPAPGPAQIAPAAVVVPPPVSRPQEPISDRSVLSAISENREQKPAPVTAPASTRLMSLPRFIPVNGVDKKFGVANPGWELYRGQVTEFKVLREGQGIKAIQVIDRGWRGLSEPFLNRALHQATQNPVFSSYTTEKKEGYQIQRGKIAENINVVYYREDKGGKLRAFVLTWR
ncbi:MAG: hypothetical protein WCI45_02915 [Desulfuromonadales bacterium]